MMFSGVFLTVATLALLFLAPERTSHTIRIASALIRDLCVMMLGGLWHVVCPALTQTLAMVLRRLKTLLMWIGYAITDWPMEESQEPQVSEVFVRADDNAGLISCLGVGQQHACHRALNSRHESGLDFCHQHPSQRAWMLEMIQQSIQL